MRFTVERKSLVDALALSHAAAGRADTIPILRNLFIDASGHGPEAGVVEFTANNLNFQTTTRAAAHVETPGKLTAPSALLFDLARAFPAGGEVEFEEVGARVEIRCGRAAYKLPTLPIKDFPLMGADKDPFAGEIEISALHRLLAKALPSASTEETRHYLKVVHLRWLPADAKLRAEATDGVRGAFIDVSVGAEFAALTDVPIPNGTVPALLSLLEASKGRAFVRVGATKIEVEASAGAIVAVLNEGRLSHGSSFPDMDRVWPTEFTRRVRCEAALLATALKRVALATDDKSTSVTAAFSADEARLSSRGVLAEGSEAAPADLEGEPIELDINAKRLLGILQQVEGSHVTLCMNGMRDPIVVEDVGDANARFLMMPLIRGGGR